LPWAAALALLTQAGIPNRGSGEAIQLEHMWVEAFVDNTPSRGAVNRAAGEWITIDPSFKQIDKQAGMDLRAAINLTKRACSTLSSRAPPARWTTRAT